MYRRDIELETRTTEPELPGVLDPVPGSAQEAQALARIDSARIEELEARNPDRAQARRRRRRHWRPRGLHVDL